MYHFLQFRSDKKEAWRMYSVDQISRVADLPGPPAFKTVLAVDQDPEEVIENELDPLELVKYQGPFYLDFDDEENLDHVLDDVRTILQHLTTKLDIPAELISCWLSGGKGVHITIPGAVFGCKSPTKFLPLIYKEVMLAIEEGAGLNTPESSVDHSVYSASRGRMWRCEGVPRPGSGTYKVGVTINELYEMDADMYQTLVAHPRPVMAVPEVPKAVSYAKAEALYKAAKVTAAKKVRAMKDATVVPAEVLQEWEGIPGCVEILITEGDCEKSNWNQAAMQLATYIAARYSRDDEAVYMEELVKPFCENVESSSRPSAKERQKHVKSQLQRAFSGKIKFGAGAFIAAIGTSCRACPICRPDIATGETEQTDASNLCHSTKMGWDHRGYFMLTDNGNRQLTSFTFWPHTEVFDLEPTTMANGMPGWKDSPRRALVGFMIDDEGKKFTDVSVSERAWGSKKDLVTAFRGQGDALVFCGDGDTQRLLKTIMTFARDKAENRELDKMTRSKVCGLILDRNGKQVVAHYVEADASITASGRSPYRFSGNARQSPSLINQQCPMVGDVEVERAITALCGVNEPIQTALTMGWFASNHFREHIQFDEPQYPLLNISGNAEAGKSSLAIVMGLLTGIDYNRAEFMNVEIGTLYPLSQYISSSTTVPRLVEEVNPQQLGSAYYKVLGLLKASWNKAPIQKGRITDRELGISEDRVSSPIVYTSEQTALVPSIRSRSVEVVLSARALLNEEYVDNYGTVMRHRESLLKIAKCLVTVAMNTSPHALLKIFHEQDHRIAKAISARPRWGYKTCLTGLHMLIHTMEEFKIGGVEAVRSLYDQLSDYLGRDVVEAERGKSSSEVDRVLSSFNMMAEEPDGAPTKLEAGRHYWRQGDSLYLVLQSCMPIYLRFSRNMGDAPVIKDFSQMSRLLEGEVYFDRKEVHPTREHAEVFVIDIGKLGRKGTSMNNFTDETEPD